MNNFVILMFPLSVIVTSVQIGQIVAHPQHADQDHR